MSRHGPFVRTAEVGTQVFDLGIGTGHTEKQLHLGTDTQAVVDLARMAQSELHKRLGMGVDVADVIALVARVLGKSKELVGQRQTYVGAGIERDGVVAAPGLEARREQRNVHVGIDAIVARGKALQCLAVSDIRIHEGGLLLVAVDAIARVVEEYVAESEIALRAHLNVAESGYRDVVLVVAIRRVEVVAEGISVDEVARVESLGHRAAGQCGQCGGHHIFLASIHDVVLGLKVVISPCLR